MKKRKNSKILFGKKLFLILTFLIIIFFKNSESQVLKDSVAKEYIFKGWDYYRMGEYEQAVNNFEKVLNLVPKKSDEYLHALYGLASVWNYRRPNENFTLARKYYEEIINIAPEHNLAAWALLGLAKMEHLVPTGEEPDYKKVIELYQKIIDKFPFHPAGEEAFIQQQNIRICSLDDGELLKALNKLQNFLETHKNSKFISPAYYLIAVCYKFLDNPEKELEYKLKSLQTRELDPNNPWIDNSTLYWEIATLAEYKVGDFNLAYKYYKKLIDEYPTDARKYRAKEALKRLAKFK